MQQHLKEHGEEEADHGLKDKETNINVISNEKGNYSENFESVSKISIDNSKTMQSKCIAENGDNTNIKVISKMKEKNMLIIYLKCHLCNKYFPNKTAMKHHVIEHEEGETAHVLKNEGNTKIKVNSNKKEYYPENFEFVSKAPLDINKPIESKNLKCKQFDAQFMSQLDLNWHEFTKHEFVEDKKNLKKENFQM